MRGYWNKQFCGYKFNKHYQAEGDTGEYVKGIVGLNGYADPNYLGTSIIDMFETVNEPHAVSLTNYNRYTYDSVDFSEWVKNGNFTSSYLDYNSTRLDVTQDDVNITFEITFYGQLEPTSEWVTPTSTYIAGLNKYTPYWRKTFSKTKQVGYANVQETLDEVTGIIGTNFIRIYPINSSDLKTNYPNCSIAISDGVQIRKTLTVVDGMYADQISIGSTPTKTINETTYYLHGAYRVVFRVLT